MHIDEHLTVIQTDTHSHGYRCHIIVNPVETLEHPVDIVLVQANTRIGNGNFHIVM